MKYPVNVNEHGCWVWTGPTCASGRYGRIAGIRLVMAHRYVFEKEFGQIPKGMCVCHTCDNGLCVNPAHLFLGTNSDNMKDMCRKGRQSAKFFADQTGEKNANAKYDRDFADRVRAYKSETNVSYRVLANVFGLKSKGHAHAIVNERIWK